MLSRRHFISRVAAGSFALTPLSAMLSACSRTSWPEGMAEIEWGRDTCARCRMVISKRLFAAEVRGGPANEVFKFDDIGCVVYWLKNQDWGGTARIWVADAGSGSDAVAWLDARRAHYLQGVKSPMGYNFAAFPVPQAGGQDFESASRQILMRGR